MQRCGWIDLLVTTLVLLLFLHAPVNAEKLDLSTNESKADGHHTGAQLERVNARIDQDANKQKIEARPHGWADPDTDRPGFDYESFWLDEGSQACQDACARDPQCKAFTYVKPGHRGQQGRCFLKTDVSAPVHNRCCVSGVKPSAMDRDASKLKPIAKDGRPAEPQDKAPGAGRSLAQRPGEGGISIAGRWSSTIGRVYDIEQEGSHFVWRVQGLDELGEGRIENRHLLAEWHGRFGPKTAEGEAVEVTPNGWAARIIWSNGVEFFRAIEQIEQTVPAEKPRDVKKGRLEKAGPSLKMKLPAANRINPQLAGRFQMLIHQKPVLNQWVKTGGPIGGLGYDVRFSSNDANGKKIVYVTDNYSGVNVSLNGGNFYMPSNDGIVARSGTSRDAIPVFSLTVDPNDPRIVWAGLKDVSGCYRSSDGGKSWEDRSPKEMGNFVFRGFAVMPGNSDIVFAAGEVPMNNPGKGFDRVKGRIYRSMDGGQHWEAVWEGNDLVRYVLINPVNPKIIYASCGIFDREAHNSDCKKPLSNNPNAPDFYRYRGGVGVLKSEDGGTTWHPLNQSNGLKDLCVGSLVMHPSNPDTLLAGAGNISASPYYLGGKRHSTGGVFLSTNGGQTWTKTFGGEIITAVEFAPSKPKIAYAAGQHSFYISRNGGKSWAKVAGFKYPWGPPGVVAGWPIDILVDPDEPGTLFVNNYGGGNVKSTDYGKSWILSSRGYTGALMFDAEIHPKNRDIVYAGARSGLFRSQDGGKTWEGLSYPQAVLAESYAVALHPKNPNIVLASQEMGGRLYRSTNGGKSWIKVFRLPKQQALNDWQYGFKRIAFARSNSQIVYAASCQKSNALDKRKTGKGVYRSVDGGLKWHPGQPANSPLAGVSVNDLEIHPKNHHIVYAATAMDGMYKTTDSGKTWTKLVHLKPKDVRCVALDPNLPNTVYAGIQLGIVYVSRNGGATWHPMASGMEPNASIWAISVDPTASNVVWAGSHHHGAYRWDGIEQQWIRFNKGLSMRAIVDMAISRDGRVIYATTKGEGVFRLQLTK